MGFEYQATHQSYDPSLPIVREQWRDTKTKEISRLDGPAVINYRTDGSMSSEQWFKDGEKFRPNGEPTVLYYHQEGHLMNVKWDLPGGGRRDMEYFSDGVTQRREEYCSGYDWHRDDGPAKTVWFKKGGLCEEKYMIDNKLHRIDGPAHIRYNADGTLKYAYWYIRGCQIKGDTLVAIQNMTRDDHQALLAAMT